jgi:hypothetical protein
MMVFAGIAAIVMATCGGYYFGRRAGSTPPTWKKRTSRIALGKLAINLLVLMTARRIRRVPPVALLLNEKWYGSLAKQSRVGHRRLVGPRR